MKEVGQQPSNTAVRASNCWENKAHESNAGGFDLTPDYGHVEKESGGDTLIY